MSATTPAANTPPWVNLSAVPEPALSDVSGGQITVGLVFF